MSRNEILLAAVTALSTTVMAQPSGWPPSSDHLTLPIWPGVAPGAPGKSAARGRHDHGKGRNLIAGRPVDSARQRRHADDHPLQSQRQALRRRRGCVSRRRLQDSGHRSGRHGGLRLAELGRRDLRAAEVSRARHGTLSQVCGGFAGCAARRWGWCGSMQPSGASIPSALASWVSRRAGICRRPSATLYEKRLYDPIDDADKLSCRPDFAVVVYPGYLALAERNLAPEPGNSSHRQHAAYVHRAGRGRSGPRGECGRLLHAVEECQGAGRVARVCAGRAWLRFAAHGIAGDRLARRRDEVAAHHSAFCLAARVGHSKNRG